MSMPTTNRRTIPSLRTSRLLTLPRELRDLIYRFALAEDGGLCAKSIARNIFGGDIYFKFYPAQSKDHEPRLESNQLRYVCRQLYAETSGLGLELNDLMFESYASQQWDASDVKLFFHFLTSCSPRQRSRVKHVTIVETHLGPLDIIGGGHAHFLLDPTLLEFFRTQPDSSLIVHFEQIDANLGDWKLACCGAALQYDLTGKMPEPADPTEPSLTPFKGTGARAKFFNPDDTSILPRNIRLFPSRSICAEERETHDLSIPFEIMEREDWIAQMRKWCQEGFGACV